MARHLRKRSFRLAGHRTSVALEAAFWAALESMAAARGVSLAALVAALDAARQDPDEPLASALRVAALHAAGEGGRGTRDGVTAAGERDPADWPAGSGAG